MTTATPDDAMREYALNATDELPDDRQPAWILTPFDVWVRNPRYSGPAVRHPEDYDMDEEGLL